MMTSIIIAVMIYAAWPHPQPGTYQFIPQGDSFLRIDTRDGTAVRCNAKLECEK